MIKKRIKKSCGCNCQAKLARAMKQLKRARKELKEAKKELARTPNIARVTAQLEEHKGALNETVAEIPPPDPLPESE